MDISNGIRGALLSAALLLPATVGIGAHATASAGCTPEAKSAVRDALTVAQLACVMASAFDLGPEVMEACDIEQKFSPVVEQMLEQKRAAKRAAACGPQDAGKDARGDR